MHPEFDATFPILLALMVLGGTLIHLLLVRSEGLEFRRIAVFYTAFVLSAFLGAKLFSAWVDGRHVLGRVDAGYRYPGAILAMVVTLPVLARLLPPGVSLARWGDLLCPGMGVSLAVYRVGCFLAGCCAGTVSTLPWAIQFPRRSDIWWSQVDSRLIPSNAEMTLPVHPLQLYFSAVSLVAGLIAFWLLPRKRYHGYVVLWFLVIHEGGKFLLEFLRYPHSTALQAASAIALVIAGITLVARARARTPEAASI